MTRSVQVFLPDLWLMGMHLTRPNRLTMCWNTLSAEPVNSLATFSIVVKTIGVQLAFLLD